MLLTDVITPGINDKQLSRLLNVTNRKLRALFLSGYNEALTDSLGKRDINAVFVPKPFTTVDLSVKIREVLDA